MNSELPSAQVNLAFSADPALLGVIRGAISMVAEQNQFAEADALNLIFTVEQTCRAIIAEQDQHQPAETLRLRLDVFPDRLEVMLEDGELEELAEASPDGYLIARGVDRVVQEQTEEGVQWLTWVKYRSRQQPEGPASGG